eukprot:TRINITY_DN2866_c0_g2_i2.p1 TRINITY_DN2866_c0_g2~~TRINITY_DN2866_c0_g2_i2.p1  ORF type:complete len:152 (-),score=27.02 TRINITY_DN2866_c0_g2_i2:271-726(-)
MNGYEMGGKQIKVQQVHAQDFPEATNLDLDEDNNANYLHSGQSRAVLMQKLIREPLPQQQMINNSIMNVMASNQPGYPYNPMMGTPYMVAPSQQSLISPTPTSCILLVNMFNPADVNLSADPEFFSDLRDEVEEECKKYGNVEKVFVEGSM